MVREPNPYIADGMVSPCIDYIVTSASNACSTYIAIVIGLFTIDQSNVDATHSSPVSRSRYWDNDPGQVPSKVLPYGTERLEFCRTYIVKE